MILYLEGHFQVGDTSCLELVWSKDEEGWWGLENVQEVASEPSL